MAHYCPPRQNDATSFTPWRLTDLGLALRRRCLLIARSMTHSKGRLEILYICRSSENIDFTNFWCVALVWHACLVTSEHVLSQITALMSSWELPCCISARTWICLTFRRMHLTRVKWCLLIILFIKQHLFGPCYKIVSVCRQSFINDKHEIAAHVIQDQLVIWASCELVVTLPYLWYSCSISSQP